MTRSICNTNMMMFLIILAVFLVVIFGALHLAHLIRRHLIWRHQQSEPSDATGKRVFGATVFDLIKGERYIVVRDFTDYYQAQFRRGAILTYRKFDFLPYHDGYTLDFVERTIYLQGEENAEFLQNTNRYLQPESKSSKE